MESINSLNLKWAMEQNALQSFLSNGERVAGDLRFFDGGPSAILSINGNTAIILVHGILTSRVYQNIHQAVQEAGRSALIKNIILDINSPGGAVAPGLDQVWQALYDLRNKDKKIIAVNTGMMASGAYWLASAAENIYTVGELTQQGSIGVFAGLLDTTELEKQTGVRKVRIVSKGAPLKNLPANSPELIAQIQKDLDHIESIFIRHIAQGRNILPQKVINDFGKGSLLVTPDAFKVGMLDGIVSMDDILKDPAGVSAKTMATTSQQINQGRSVEERVAALKVFEGQATAPSTQTSVDQTTQAHHTPQTERTVEQRLEAIRH